jgi:hypothetical protein
MFTHVVRLKQIIATIQPLADKLSFIAQHRIVEHLCVERNIIFIIKVSKRRKH